MKNNIFINRYVMACAIAIVITLVGFICMSTLPVEQYPNIAGRLESFVDRVSESGLIDGAALKRNPTWLFIDWTGSKLESTTALNMIYYGALQAGARLADRLGEKADAERWRDRAHSVKAALMAKAWDSERGLFRFSVDEDGAKPGHFTRHGNIYAVIFGVAGDGELKSIGAALAGEELPPVGTPYVAAYEAMALIRCGRKADARRLIEKVWGGMLDAGATSFWEGFDAKELSSKAGALVENLNAVAEKIKSGEGTLGKLADSSEMYDELNGLIKDARQVLDNYRDTTPISTFSSLAAGAL